MANDKDLFLEEQSMVSMSFGDHIEDLRSHLIKALLGLFAGILITLLPPMHLGIWVTRSMQDPAKKALKEFYQADADRRAAEADRAEADTRVKQPPIEIRIEADSFVEQLKAVAPSLSLPSPADVKGKYLKLTYKESDLIRGIPKALPKPEVMVTLAPLEGITIYFMVCMVAGLVIASPWVFYQLWAFVAAGLYRHERHYVHKFLPFSLGLFLGGVFLCFFGVLPVTMMFLLQFNVWLGITPTLRLSEWMGFATILPLVFGLCFQTPLIMMFLERIGIVSVEQFRAKRRIAILIMIIAAAVLTPGPDVFSQLMLAIPMISLYELGIFLVSRRHRTAPVEATVE